MKPIVVLTTAGSQKQAGLIARQLVERRHAACVSILPIQRSVYRWEGKLCEEAEFLLLIKSTGAEYAALEAAIQDLHDYEQPEILMIDLAGGEAGYLQWLTDSVGAKADDDRPGEP